MYIMSISIVLTIKNFVVLYMYTCRFVVGLTLVRMSLCVFTKSILSRKLTAHQKELITEFAKSENLVNGTVDGVDEGQCVF